ncbi:hypothetical protein IG631_21935 [Alternaria alternata]|jgi:hypothetical protein|nr:hypothetical protein IG631_21935 [Alternaria alternata]
MPSAENSQTWSDWYKTSSEYVSQPWKEWYKPGVASQMAGMRLWPIYVAGNKVNGKVQPLGVDLGIPKPRPEDD